MKTQHTIEHFNKIQKQYVSDVCAIILPKKILGYSYDKFKSKFWTDTTFNFYYYKKIKVPNQIVFQIIFGYSFPNMLNITYNVYDPNSDYFEFVDSKRIVSDNFNFLPEVKEFLKQEEEKFIADITQRLE